MNYIGSKQKLSALIIGYISEVVGNLSHRTFADIFVGTGAIAKVAKPLVKKVIANDIEYFNYVLAQNYIANNEPLPQTENLVVELNATLGIEGFIFQHYCLGGGKGRQYFSNENGKKIDAMRQKIALWQAEQHINQQEYYFLLCSLLESTDKVANTASVYGAFLKHLKKTAKQPLLLQPTYYSLVKNQQNIVFQQEANTLIDYIEGDILYLDPPYNARQYGANYHLLNTIALYDTHFTPQGKTGLRPTYHKSTYCQKHQALQSLEQLIQKAQFQYIFLSYNNEGIIPLPQLSTMLKKYGHYDVQTIPYQRFKADKTENRQHKADQTIEYLHIIEKSQ